MNKSVSSEGLTVARISCLRISSAFAYLMKVIVVKDILNFIIELIFHLEKRTVEIFLRLINCSRGVLYKIFSQEERKMLAQNVYKRLDFVSVIF